MTSYLLRRVLLLVVVVWGALTVIFFLFFTLPGDPAQFLAGSPDRAVAEGTREQVVDRYGLDDPVVVQYVDYMTRVAVWDLGESFKTRENVNDIFNRTVVASLRLGFWSLVIIVVIGITTGVYSAVRRHTFGDALVTVSTAAAAAVPAYVLGLLLQTVFAIVPYQLGWPGWLSLPTGGIGPDTWVLGVVPVGDQWRYLVLPALTLAAVSTATVARLTRVTLLEVQGADYMRTARAKGLGESAALVRHGLRNALIPVTTFVAVDIGTVIGAAVLTETVFNWPGLGSRMARAVAVRDFSVILGLSIAITLIYATANLVADLVCAWLDPRVRVRGGGAQR